FSLPVMKTLTNSVHVFEPEGGYITKSFTYVNSETGSCPDRRDVAAHSEGAALDTHFPLVAGFCGKVVSSVEELSMLRHSFGRNDRRILVSPYLSLGKC